MIVIGSCMAALAAPMASQEVLPFEAQRAANVGHQVHLTGFGVSVLGLGTITAAGVAVVADTMSHIPDGLAASLHGETYSHEPLRVGGVVGVGVATTGVGLALLAAGPVMGRGRLRAANVRTSGIEGWFGVGLMAAGAVGLGAAVALPQDHRAVVPTAVGGVAGLLGGITAASMQDVRNRSAARGAAPWLACAPGPSGVACRF